MKSSSRINPLSSNLDLSNPKSSLQDISYASSKPDSVILDPHSISNVQSHSDSSRFMKRGELRSRQARSLLPSNGHKPFLYNLNGSIREETKEGSVSVGSYQTVGSHQVRSRSSIHRRPVLEGVNQTVNNQRIHVEETSPGDKRRKSTEEDIKMCPLLLFIPKEERKGLDKSTNYQGFYSFKEIARRTQDGYEKYKKSAVDYLGVLEGKARLENKNHLRSLRKLLHENKRFEKDYNNETRTDLKNFTSLITRKKDEECHKREMMPVIRVYPSINVSHQHSGVADVSAAKWTFSAKESPAFQPKFVDKKKEKEYIETKMKHIYRFYWSSTARDQPHWRPEVRERHTLTAIGTHIVLYGGISTSPIEEIAVFNVVNKRWTKPEVTGDTPPIGRRGHSACVYKNSIVVFGGQHQFNDSLNFRECFNDVRLFTPVINEWKYLKCSGKAIEARWNHTAGIYGKRMIVYGGLNSEGKSLFDVWVLNLKTAIWSQLDIREEDRDTSLSSHAMCECFEPKIRDSRERIHLTKRIAQQGLYVFGGKNSQGYICNTLRILVLSKTQSYWEYPEIKGIPPLARYGHSMVYYRPLNLILIYGGKNDSPYNKTGNVFLNDICILNIELMSWMSSTNFGVPLFMPRYYHAATISGTKMLIFGGLEPSEYANDNLTFVELNQGEVKNLLQPNENVEQEKTDKQEKKERKEMKEKKEIKEFKEKVVDLKEKKSVQSPFLSRQESDKEIESNGASQIEEGQPKFVYNRLKSWLPLPRNERVENDYKNLRSKSQSKTIVCLTRISRRGSLSPSTLKDQR